MPRVKVKSQGQILGEVDVPESATRGQVIEAAKKAGLRAPKPPEAVPSGDIVGRLKERLLREPPPGTETPISPMKIARPIGRAVLPGSLSDAAVFAATLPMGGSWATGPLKRIPTAAATAGGVAYAQGKPWSEITGEALRAGVTQAGGELLPGALGGALAQRRGSRLLRDAEALTKHDTAMHEALSGAEGQAFKEATARHRTAEANRLREARAQHQEAGEAARRAHKAQVESQEAAHQVAVARASAEAAQATRQWEQAGAAQIAEAYKAQVPAWREIDASERGLVDMVYGSGQKRLSQSFDVAMAEIRQSGHGQPVEITTADALKLGFTWDRKVPGKPQAKPVDSTNLDRAYVMADELAERSLGRWKKDPGLYRRVVGALDRAGIGNPQARAEYAAGQSLIQFADRSKMLKGGRFNPDSARLGLTNLKTVDELRRRGAGHALEGPVAQVAQRERPEGRVVPDPTPIPEPSRPAFRRPTPGAAPTPPDVRVAPPAHRAEGVTVRTMPRMGYVEGAALAEVPLLIHGLATGNLRYTPYGLLGGAASHALSRRQIVTRVPQTPAERFALQVSPTALGQAGRSMTEAP